MYCKITKAAGILDHQAGKKSTKKDNDLAV